jgi:hypothetical protein
MESGMSRKAISTPNPFQKQRCDSRDVHEDGSAYARNNDNEKFTGGGTGKNRHSTPPTCAHRLPRMTSLSSDCFIMRA